jgi:pimeloyl-ACP methyl ester carboxylesterase
MASFGHKVIRSLFSAAEHLAPRLAGRVAFELFCRTADPNRLSLGERRAIAGAGSFMEEARHHCLRTKTGFVNVHEFRLANGMPRAGTVLILHGWRSRTEYMKAVIDGFRQAGYRVVSLDLPGHGRSPGRRLNMALAVDAVHTAGEWFGPFDAVVGHSFGGAVAIAAVAGSIESVPPLSAERLVLISAPNSMPAIFEEFSRLVNLGPRSWTTFAGQVERVTGRPLSEFICSEQLGKLSSRTLVIHAPDDREVSPDDARELARAGEHVRLHWAPGLGHRRILTDSHVVQTAVQFVERTLVH